MNTHKKKIVLLGSSLAGGGSERVLVGIANSFAEKDWEVELIILNLKNEAFLYRLSKKINLIILKANHARYAILPLLKYIFQKKPNLIFVFNKELAVILAIIRFFLRIKIKIILRNNILISAEEKNLVQKNFWNKFVIRPLINFFIFHSDHIINQCYAMHYDLISKNPKFQFKSSVIFNPVASHIIDYANKIDLSKIEKKDYILCVGRLEKQKAFHYAIEAFAGIADKFINLRLKIVGKGSLEKELKQKAINCGVGNRVDFEGFQKDIISYYLYAKATVLTSLYEGYPNVLIESIALNTPTVAFNCLSGPNEIIQDGLNGYLVKYRDLDDLKDKLSASLTKKFNFEDLKKSLKKNQIESVIKSYEQLIKLVEYNSNIKI